MDLACVNSGSIVRVWRTEGSWQTENGRSSMGILSWGEFGVRLGKLDDGREIAVKKLSQTSRQGKTEFKNEARLLTRIQHRNVVTLLGYCASKGEKLLVYEYVQHESLDKLLFRVPAVMADLKMVMTVIKGMKSLK